MEEEKLFNELSRVYDCILNLHRIHATENYHSLSVRLIGCLLPQIQVSIHVQALEMLLHERPQILNEQHSNGNLLAVYQDPPPNDLCLKILLRFHELAHLMNGISSNELFGPKEALPPLRTGEDYTDQMKFMGDLIQIFKSLTTTKVNEIAEQMKTVLCNAEFAFLTETISSVPFHHVNLLRNIFHWPVNRILVFQQWACNLDEQSIALVLRLFRFSNVELQSIMGSLSNIIGLDNVVPPPAPFSSVPSAVAPVKVENSTLDFDFENASLGISWMDSILGVMSSSTSNPLGDFPATLGASQNIYLAPEPSSQTQFVPPAVLSPETINNFTPTPDQKPQQGRYILRIRQQPPGESVYQRILKPNPKISLEGPSNMRTENVYVEAVAIRGDSEDEIASVLDGNKTVQVRKKLATFSKLKLTQTSQMKGTFFRLKFLIKIYDDKEYKQEGSYIISNPIEVFSHSQYLSSANSKKNPAPPIVKEILPAEGGSQCRLVILGNNFVKNPKLVVRFDSVPVIPEFHEQGTLLCNAPPCDVPGTQVRVTVANDSVHFCKPLITFTYK